ncbi:MAG: alkyl hydroperoxide reductase AhpD [Melioribacteraceae bacterium]|nr:MAG: alkyl hydroperoxide reductase AhpD [Melioribacteraceae bacterium]
MGKNIDEFREHRQKMNDRILGSDFRDYKKFFALDNKAYIDGALPKKSKELMGLVASMVLRCNDCILYHIDKAIEAGATEQELHETFNIALIVGGSIVIPHLRFAVEQMDEIFERKNG